MARKPPPLLFDAFLRQADKATTPPKRRRRQPVSSRKQRAVAKKAEPKLQRAVVKAAQDAAAGTRTTVVRAAIAAGDLEAAVAAVPWDVVGRELRATHGAVIRETFEGAGRLEASRIGTSFDVLNERSLQAMRQLSWKKGMEFGTLQPQELRAMLAEMVERGLSVNETADLFKRELGLTARLNTAVLNFREAQIARGLEGDRLRRSVERKTEELLRYRARTVARTEAQAAATQGQLATWEVARADGLLDVETFEQEWICSSDPCEKICDAAEGQRRKLGELFELGDGTMVDGPPGHPNCLCTLVGHANRKSESEAA